MDYNIKNKKYNFKKEKDKNFFIAKNIFDIEPKKEKWKANLVDWASLEIHEFSHYYFIKFQYKKFKNKKFYSFFEEGFANYLEYLMRLKYKVRDDWQREQFERVKKDENLYKEVWDYVSGKLLRKHQNKVMFMRLTFQKKEKIKKYIYDFWRHFDDLYFLSTAIVQTMEEYYGFEKFKEILMLYRDGIEKEKLKEMAEESIKTKWFDLKE